MTEINNQVRVAFIGCGNIAHVHMRFLQKAGYRLDSVCDASRVRVTLFAQKYGIAKQYTTIDELFAVENPRIVHILTPPHTHYEIILKALKAGCNVLVEKPLCQTLLEYQEIASLAEELGLLVSVDHTRVYNPLVMAARSKIMSGEFGKIIRMEYLYDDPSLIKSLYGYRWAKGAPAWFARVRGGVLTDLLPHPLSVFLSFDEGLQTKHVHARVLPGGVIEELSVILQSDILTANIYLSVNQRPLKNKLSIYCEKGSIDIDLRNMYAVCLPERRLPGILSRVMVTLSESCQIAKHFSVNVLKLVTGKSHPYDGLDQIIMLFYNMVTAGKSEDVPLINADRVMELVEEIMTAALDAPDKTINEHTTPVQNNVVRLAHPADFLVFGGTGFIGRRIVDALLNLGKSVRVFCRQTSNVSLLPNVADISYGDVKDSASVIMALSGIKTVIHCAAAMSGDWAEFYESTVQGTNNLLAAMENSTVERFVYISSLGVLDYNRLSNGARVDESSQIEARPVDRGFYTRAKVEAEQLVKEFAERNRYITTIILRPGLVYGQESNNNLQNCGILIDKILLVFGRGKRQLGLNYVENLADAVVEASSAKLSNGSLFHIVDQEQPTVKEIIKEHNRISNTKVVPVYVPIFIWKTLFRAVDLLLYMRSRNIGTFYYRFASNSKILYYSCDKAMKELGWRPRLDFKESFLRTYISGRMRR
jgi:predicted dehydrogenase